MVGRHNAFGEHGEKASRDAQHDQTEGQARLGPPGQRDLVAHAEGDEQSRAHQEGPDSQREVEPGAAPDGLVQLSRVAFRHVLGEVAHRGHGNTQD